MPPLSKRVCWVLGWLFAGGWWVLGSIHSLDVSGLFRPTFGVM